MGSLMVGGVIYIDRNESAIALIVIGSLLFCPGAYFTRIAYYSFQDVEGFSFKQLPSFQN